MPFEIVRNDITNMCVDAIVNTANPEPIIGYGCDAGIHKKAGPKLLEARKKKSSAISHWWSWLLSSNMWLHRNVLGDFRREHFLQNQAK